MQIQNSLYHKCWEIEDKGNFKKINIGDSKKDKEGNYKNCTWNGIIVGNAKEIAINKGDTFTIKSGQIFQEKVGDKYYTNVVVFDLEVTKKAEAPSKLFDEPEGFSAMEDNDEILF